MIDFDRSSPPNCRYEEYLQYVKDVKAQTSMDIDSIYRYYDDEKGKEYFWYHATYKILEGQIVRATCYCPHVGNSKEFPPTDEFLYNKRNLDRIKGHFHKKTNYCFVANGGTHRAIITRQQFLEHERDIVTASFKTVKMDINDLTEAMANATKMSVEAQSERQKRDSQ